MGSKAELAERATAPGSTSSRSSGGRGSTRCRSAARRAARRSSGSRRSATSGSTPASSRSRRSAGRAPSTSRGLRDGRGEGAHDGRSPRPRLLGGVVPRGLGVGDARADPALVLLAALHVGRADGPRAVSRACSATRRCSTRTGREMHSSWGNTIDAPDAFARMGADVMRWQYCSQPPNQNLLFGFGPGARDPAEAAHALELVQVPRRLRQHRRLGARVGRSRRRPERRARAARPLARRADARARRRGDRRATRAGSRSTSSAPTRRSSTTSRTGTSGARGAGSGTATRSRCGRSGTRSSRGCASSRRSCRSSRITSGAC